MGSQGENCLWKYFDSQAQFEDLGLNYRIQEENAKNSTSGSTQ
jgi:hypothetical protein